MEKFRKYLGIAAILAMILMVGYFIGAAIAYLTGFMEMQDFVKVTFLPAAIALAILGLDVVVSEIHERFNKKED